MDIDMLLMLQDLRNGGGSVLVTFLQKMTFFGELSTVIALMALVYWAVDKKLGTYYLMGWSGNRLANGFLKVTVCAYRPWIRDARIVPYGDSMTTATGYSFPSGHTTNAGTILGGLAVRKDMGTLLRVLSFVGVLLVGFSRLYLGVHTPQDVIVGMAASMLVMYLTYRLLCWLEVHPEKDMLVLVIGLVLAIALAIYAAVKPYPADYTAEGKLIVDGAKMANDTFKAVGYCSAFLIGWILERRFVNFTTDGVSMKDRLIRVVGGFLGYYVIELILKKIITDNVPSPVNSILVCFIAIFYVTFLCPLAIKFIERKRGEVGQKKAASGARGV